MRRRARSRGLVGFVLAIAVGRTAALRRALQVRPMGRLGIDRGQVVAQDPREFPLVQVTRNVVGRVPIGDVLGKHALALAQPVHALTQDRENVEFAFHALPNTRRI